MTRLHAGKSAVVALMLSVVMLMASVLSADVCTRASVSSTGGQSAPSKGSSFPSISADGRYVVFEAPDGGLVPGDTNTYADIFVHDTKTGQTRCISRSPDGQQSNGSNTRSRISADGQYVVFRSLATNMTWSSDINGAADIFRASLSGGPTVRVSDTAAGIQANGGCNWCDISQDGRYVAFYSGATNIVPGDTNGKGDVFVKDLATGAVVRASVATDGTQGNDSSGGLCLAISGDGRRVVFSSPATNLVPGDTNGMQDIFVRDLISNTTTCVSVSSTGVQGNARSGMLFGVSISGDGRYVAFDSDASNLVPDDTNIMPNGVSATDVFVYDMQTGLTRRVSVRSDGGEANYGGFAPCVSYDGTCVVFESPATNMGCGDSRETWQVYEHDLVSNQTRMITESISGGGNQSSDWPRVSGDGRYVVVQSGATDFVLGDTNAAGDAYVFDSYRIMNAKGTPNTYPVTLSARTVTSISTGHFFIEEPNRSCGIKVEWTGSTNVGDRYRIEGQMGTDENGDRCVVASDVRRIDSLPLAPLGMTNVQVGGAATSGPVVQQGVTGAYGLNNIGLLVTVWGEVTYTGSGFIYIDDGSGLDDGSGHPGLKVLAPGVTLPGEGSYVIVTGISSCYTSDSKVYGSVRTESITVRWPQ